MKTIIGIATMKGREKYLSETLKSLQGQAYEIHVYHNHKELVDYTDNAKFYFLQFYKEPIYYFSCDDDIIYPKTYISDMMKLIDKYGIVSHHGRFLSGGIGANYYKGHDVFRCGNEVNQLLILDVVGTGVCGFRTDYFNPVNLYKSKIQRMSDLIFSLEATKQGKQMVLATHSADYFQIQNVPENETIYGQENRKCYVQNVIANQILKVKKSRLN